MQCGFPRFDLVRCEVTDISGGETLRRFDVQPGELCGDRAYDTPGHDSCFEQVYKVTSRLRAREWLL